MELLVNSGRRTTSVVVDQHEYKEEQDPALYTELFPRMRWSSQKMNDARAIEQVLVGEFDPGSGRTLAACLTHASRTRFKR